MIVDGREVRLAGSHFMANIAMPSVGDGGIVSIVRDPRKLKKKLEIYPGIVEEVGDRCSLVKPGDRVAFQRWDWGQFNVDDERIVASESDLIVLGDNVPAPGIIILKLKKEPVKDGIILPQNMREKKEPFYCGMIAALSDVGLRHMSGLVGVGDVLYFQRSDSYQWHFGDGNIAIRVCGYFDILAVIKKEDIEFTFDKNEIKDKTN